MKFTTFTLLTSLVASSVYAAPYGVRENELTARRIFGNGNPLEETQKYAKIAGTAIGSSLKAQAKQWLKSHIPGGPKVPSAPISQPIARDEDGLEARRVFGNGNPLEEGKQFAKHTSQVLGNSFKDKAKQWIKGYIPGSSNASPVPTFQAVRRALDGLEARRVFGNGNPLEQGKQFAKHASQILGKSFKGKAKEWIKSHLPGGKSKTQPPAAPAFQPEARSFDDLDLERRLTGNIWKDGKTIVSEKVHDAAESVKYQTHRAAHKIKHKVKHAVKGHSHATREFDELDLEVRELDL